MSESPVSAQPASAQSTIDAVRAVFAPTLFAGKTVLVTGGSRGIGRGIALAFGSLGAHVIVNYFGNEAAATEVRDLVVQAGGKATIARFDVGNFTETQEAIKRLESEVGGIDVLINNAGIARDGLLVRAKEEDWDTTLDTNLKSCFNCARAVAMSMMKRHNGVILNITSVVGLMGNAGQTAYAASKAGVIGFTKSLARELASRNVRVNAIAPGFIETDMTASLPQKAREDLSKQIPLVALGKSTDIAQLAVFLASPGAAYVTGQIYAVDGGMTMM